MEVCKGKGGIENECRRKLEIEIKIMRKNNC